MTAGTGEAPDWCLACVTGTGPRDRGRQCRQGEEGDGEKTNVACSCCVQYVFACWVCIQHLLRATGWVRYGKDCETGEVPTLGNSDLVEKPNSGTGICNGLTLREGGRSKVLGRESPESFPTKGRDLMSGGREERGER